MTVVPGLRPRLRETVSEPPRRWAEEGRWGPFRAVLTLSFEPGSRAGTCRVEAGFVVRGIGLGPLATACARPAIAADLRRAARLLGR